MISLVPWIQWTHLGSGGLHVTLADATCLIFGVMWESQVSLNEDDFIWQRSWEKPSTLVIGIRLCGFHLWKHVRFMAFYSPQSQIQHIRVTQHTHAYTYMGTHIRTCTSEIHSHDAAHTMTRPHTPAGVLTRTHVYPYDLISCTQPTSNCLPTHTFPLVDTLTRVHIKHRQKTHICTCCFSEQRNLIL